MAFMLGDNPGPPVVGSGPAKACASPVVVPRGDDGFPGATGAAAAMKSETLNLQ